MMRRLKDKVQKFVNNDIMIAWAVAILCFVCFLGGIAVGVAIQLGVEHSAR